jgi:hypothetical protein
MLSYVFLELMICIGNLLLGFLLAPQAHPVQADLPFLKRLRSDCLPILIEILQHTHPALLLLVKLDALFYGLFVVVHFQKLGRLALVALG